MTQHNLLIHLKSAACFLDIAPSCFGPLEKQFPDLRLHFVDTYKELTHRISEADYVVSWRFDADLYAHAPHLRAVYTPAAGREGIQPDPMGKVQVFYGTFHGRLMAETLIGMILFFNCRLDACRTNQRRRVWNRDVTKGMRLLDKQKILIVGYGAIGRACAERLNGFGAEICGIQRRFPDGIDPQSSARYAGFEKIEEELAAADHVVLLLPGTPENRHIITRRHLAVMKPTAFLYNLGRGSVIAENDLVDSLEGKEIAGAGLDVFEEEPLPRESRLWDCENVLIIPHASAGYVEYGTLFVEELIGRLKKFYI